MTKSGFNIDDIIIRYFSGETIISENKTLQSWISESSENLSYFNTLRNIWLASSQLNPSDTSFRLNKSFDATETKKRLSSFLWKAAAILVILILSGIILLKQNVYSPVHSNNYWVSVEATLGSRATTTLPDGTFVWLNSGSKLIYSNNYDKEIREVKLVGEAYFDVKTNPAKPFVVRAGKLAIKAMGTSFNVKAYPDEYSIITTLVKGKVIIEGKDKEDKDFSVDLNPKQTYTYFADKKEFAATKATLINDKLAMSKGTSQLIMDNLLMVKMDKVKTELYTSWRDKSWVVENQYLVNFARLLERRYNVTIELGSESIKKFRFSGTIQNETIEQIMEIIIYTMPLKYSVDKGKFSLTEDPKRIQEFYR